MKAITLTQPWASLVAIGEKRIETRSWRTNYRGPLAIHAAKGLAPVGGFRGLRALCAQEPFRSVMKKYDLDPYSFPTFASSMPFGFVVATAVLIDVVPTEAVHPLIHGMAEHEIDFGDYSKGRYAWILGFVKRLLSPVAKKGSLGLWECEL